MNDWPTIMLREHGWTAERFLDLTPYEFAAAFMGVPDDSIDGPPISDLGMTAEAVIEWNRRYAKMSGFNVPSWFLPHLIKKRGAANAGK